MEAKKSQLTFVNFNFLALKGQSLNLVKLYGQVNRCLQFGIRTSLNKNTCQKDPERFDTREQDFGQVGRKILFKLKGQKIPKVLLPMGRILDKLKEKYLPN